jgi:hypothetical protein
MVERVHPSCPIRRNGVPVTANGAAASRSLRWADYAAQRADYAIAVGWVQTAEGLCDELPDEYKTKRSAWLRALGRGRSIASPTAQAT